MFLQRLTRYSTYTDKFDVRLGGKRKHPTIAG